MIGSWVFSGNMNSFGLQSCVSSYTNQTPLATEKALGLECGKKLGTLLRRVLAVQGGTEDVHCKDLQLKPKVS